MGRRRADESQLAREPRVSILLQAGRQSVEGLVLEYGHSRPATSRNAMMLRPLVAWYRPFAAESVGSCAEQLRRIARESIHELQFRILQIQQAFLSDEPPVELLDAPPVARAVPQPLPNDPLSQFLGDEARVYQQIDVFGI
jgi:hypothetical protein